MINPKPQKFWAITYTNCPEAMPDTIRRTRAEAKKACCDGRHQFRADNWKDEWREWAKLGCKAIRVTVQARP
jgi:hypothetical protein